MFATAEKEPPYAQHLLLIPTPLELSSSPWSSAPDTVFGETSTPHPPLSPSAASWMGAGWPSTGFWDLSRPVQQEISCNEAGLPTPDTWEDLSKGRPCAQEKSAIPRAWPSVTVIDANTIFWSILGCTAARRAFSSAERCQALCIHHPDAASTRVVPQPYRRAGLKSPCGRRLALGIRRRAI